MTIWAGSIALSATSGVTAQASITYGGSASLGGTATFSATLSYGTPLYGSRYVPAGSAYITGNITDETENKATAQNWRLYIYSNNGDGNYTELNELEFSNPYGEVVEAVGGSPIFSTEYWGANFAFDGDYTNRWATTAGDHEPCFIGYSFPSPVEIGGFRLVRQGAYFGADAVPTEFVLQYSDDGISWTDLGVRFNETYTFDSSEYHISDYLLYRVPAGEIEGAYLDHPETTLSGTMVQGGVYNADSAVDELGEPTPEAPLLIPESTLSGVISEGGNALMFPSLSGVGWTGNAGNGDLRGLTASVSATALFGKTFSGDLTAPLPSIESRYTIGEITALIASVDAEAIFSHVWSGSIRPGAPALSGEATFDTAAMTGRAQLLLPSLSASALIGIAGAGDIQIKKQLLSATGFTGKVFTGQLTAPMVTLSAGGDVVGIWTADIELPIVQVYATGEIAVSAARVFAINTKTTAVTEYTGFGFDSMVTFNGVVLGVNGDGLYAITGDSDDGTDIDAFLRTGITDFGSSQLKRVSSAFVNYRTDGEMELQVTVDNDESYCYPLDGNAIDQIHTDEVKIGRGLDGRNWQFEFRNVLGADFELDAVEYDVTQLVRKLR